jgi:hypothetical protein
MLIFGATVIHAALAGSLGLGAIGTINQIKKHHEDSKRA